jgi:hypothetical protein
VAIKAARDAAIKNGTDPIAAAKAAGGVVVYEELPAALRFLELFVRLAKVRSIHWFPYDRVRVVNADP